MKAIHKVLKPRQYLSNCDKSKMTSTICDNCKGSGMIRISSFAKDAIPCPACKGTGMQEIVRM